MTRRVPTHVAEQARERVLALAQRSAAGAPSERARQDGPGWLPDWPPEDAAPVPDVPRARHGAARRVLLAAERPAVAGLGLVGLLAVAVAVTFWVLGRPHAVAVAPRVESSGAALVTGSARGAPTTRPAASPEVVVDVVGFVRHPGVVTLSGTSRVADAVRAAGGAVAPADLSAVNLARRVVDGEQIVVPAKGQAVVPAPAAAAGGGTGMAPGASAGGGSPVDLNAATLAELDGLPGVGPVLAQRILDWRTAHGRFTTVDELREVTGIGASRFDDLKQLVRV